jgi:hypothetical protein
MITLSDFAPLPPEKYIFYPKGNNSEGIFDNHKIFDIAFHNSKGRIDEKHRCDGYYFHSLYRTDTDLIGPDRKRISHYPVSAAIYYFGLFYREIPQT